MDPYREGPDPPPAHYNTRHSTENITYGETWDPLTQGQSERRHSFSSDYEGRGDRLRQTWFDSIRDRYHTSNRGSRRETPFPKTLDNYRTKYSEIKNTIIRSGSKFWEEADKRRITERRKKTVRFDGGPTALAGTLADDEGWMTLGNAERWDGLRQTSAESAARDSGIDSSSNFTSSEDSTRGDFKVPYSLFPNPPFQYSYLVLFLPDQPKTVLKSTIKYRPSSTSQLYQWRDGNIFESYLLLNK